MLEIKGKESCLFDEVSLGEVMLRLDLGEGRIKTPILGTLIKRRIAAIGFSADRHLISTHGILGVIRPNALILGYLAIFSREGASLSKYIHQAQMNMQMIRLHPRLSFPHGMIKLFQ